MNAVALLCVSGGFVSAAMAARPLSSTIVVQVLSVMKISSRFETPSMSQGQVVGGPQRLEDTDYLADVRIQNVIRSDLDLSPGETLGIHYTVVTGAPIPLPITRVPLRPGASATLTVFKDTVGYRMLRSFGEGRVRAPLKLADENCPFTRFPEGRQSGHPSASARRCSRSEAAVPLSAIAGRARHSINSGKR